MKTAEKGQGIEGTIFQALKHRIHVRKEQPAFGNNKVELVETHNEHVLGFMKKAGDEEIVVIQNFSEKKQEIRCWMRKGVDLLTGNSVELNGTVELSGYQGLWVKLNA